MFLLLSLLPIWVWLLAFDLDVYKYTLSSYYSLVSILSKETSFSCLRLNSCDAISAFLTRAHCGSYAWPFFVPFAFPLGLGVMVLFLPIALGRAPCLFSQYSVKRVRANTVSGGVRCCFFLEWVTHTSRCWCSSPLYFYSMMNLFNSETVSIFAIIFGNTSAALDERAIWSCAPWLSILCFRSLYWQVCCKLASALTNGKLFFYCSSALW